MKKFRPNKKGFTLVEEIVSVLLIGILIASASAIMMSSLHIFARNVITLNAQERGIAVMNQLEEHIKYAKEISGAATDTLSSPYQVTLTLEKDADDKYYLKSESNFKQYSDSDEKTNITNTLCSLGTYKTEYTISKAAGSVNAVVIDVKVYCRGSVYYSDERTVRLMNRNADIKLTSAVDQEHELYIGSIE
ncbi:MAG: PilW family protein [Ruminococcus sp.]